MKKFISLILCLAMMLSFVTVFASAKDGSTIKVSGKSYDATIAQSGAGWNWNTNGTLTLNGYNSGTIELFDVPVVKIDIKGVNTIGSDGLGISSNGKIEIAGIGSLAIDAGDIGIQATDLTLASGTISINSDSSYAVSVYDMPDDDFRSAFTISGAKVSVTAKTNEAVFVDGNITVSAGKLAAKTDAEKPAIVAYAFTESYVTSTGDTAWYDKDFGEYKVTVVDGATITPEDVAFVPVNGKSGEAYTDETYSDESYTSDIYKDTSATGASWDRTGYYKMVATANTEKLSIDGKTWTYGEGYINDVVIDFTKSFFSAGKIVRIFGANRMNTALASAESLKRIKGVNKFDNIIIAAGADKNCADALSGSYLASVKGAPIVLALPNKDNTSVIDYVYHNFTGNGNVYILGDTPAVSAEFENELKTKLGEDASKKVVRLAGKNRYGTNIAILKEVGFIGDSLVVCTGENFPDALSASALGLPILIVKNSMGGLFDYQRDYLDDISSNVKNIYFIGSEKAVKASFETTIGSYFEGVKINRLEGTNRYETSKAVANYFYKDTDILAIATGANPADALAAAPIAQTINAPIMLVANNNTKDMDNAVAFAKKSMSDDYMVVFGSIKAIPDETSKSIISGEIISFEYPPQGK